MLSTELAPPIPVHSVAEELSLAWSLELRLETSAYMAAHRLTPALMLRVDVVLMLLRIGTAEALGRAQELTGKPIRQCPSAVPPWPPRPVAATPRGPVILSMVPNPCSPGTDMHRRYAQVTLGRTREQLLSRGVTCRDLSYWQKKGHVTFTKGNTS